MTARVWRDLPAERRRQARMQRGRATGARLIEEAFNDRAAAREQMRLVQPEREGGGR